MSKDGKKHRNNGSSGRRETRSSTPTVSPPLQMRMPTLPGLVEDAAVGVVAEHVGGRRVNQPPDAELAARLAHVSDAERDGRGREGSERKGMKDRPE